MERPPSSSPLASIPAPAPDASDPLIGETLADRYVIERLIGAGGMARVYLARHKLIGRMVAVKMLKRALADDEGLVRRFMHEGRAVGTLGHPNIVESLDMGTTADGAPFLVLEYLDGMPLSAAIDRVGTLSIGRAAYIGSQIAMAVGAANERGVVHRDLKPDNVFLVHRNGLEDHVKVLDFGVSKFLGAEDHTGHTSHGSLVGTPEYMAPEQIGGETVDRRADVYSVGIILYEMLTGTSPFRRASVQETLRAVFVDDPKPLHSVRPGLPSELVKVIEQATTKHRDARLADMQELVGLLEPFIERPTPSSNAPRPDAPSSSETLPALRREISVDRLRGRAPSGSETLPATPVPVTHPATMPSRPAPVTVSARAPALVVSPSPGPRRGAAIAIGLCVVGAIVAVSMRDRRVETPLDAPSAATDRASTRVARELPSASTFAAAPSSASASIATISAVSSASSLPPVPSARIDTTPSAHAALPVGRPRAVTSASTKPVDPHAALPILTDR